MTALTREQMTQALIDDAWEGHEGPLTVADLESIVSTLMPPIEAAQADAWDEGYAACSDDFERHLSHAPLHDCDCPEDPLADNPYRTEDK